MDQTTVPTQLERTVAIRAVSHFLANESAPEQERYVFSYEIEIKNCAEQAVKLITRQWRITDGHKRVEKVSGVGVVGEQPTIKPGETFTYRSFAVLKTPMGSMRGFYQMVAADRTAFNATIPEFQLNGAYALH